MHLCDFLGMVANVTSNIAFVPQIIKSFKLKSVNDVSIGMFTLLFFTQICWIAYAVPLGAWQLALSSSIEIILLLPIFVMWWRYSKPQHLSKKLEDAPLKLVSDT